MTIPTRAGSLMVTGLAGVDVRIGKYMGEVMSVESESVPGVFVMTGVGWRGVGRSV